VLLYHHIKNIFLIHRTPVALGYMYNEQHDITGTVADLVMLLPLQCRNQESCRALQAPGISHSSSWIRDLHCHLSQM